MTSNSPTGATLITVAPTGAEAEKASVPALPVTLDELVTTAKECQAAGASVVHVHIRDAGARPTLDPGRQRRAGGAGGHARRTRPAPPDAARAGARDAWGERP